MTFLKSATTVLGMVACASSSAVAQVLDRLLPRLDESACYGRSYDKAHLSRHPDQLVTSMILSLREWRGDIGQSYEGYQATVGVAIRGQSKRHVTSSLCQRAIGSDILKCSIECDGGLFNLVSSSRRGSITLELDRLSFDVSCDGEFETLTLSAGIDDKSFRLDPVEPSNCRELELQFERVGR